MRGRALGAAVLLVAAAVGACGGSSDDRKPDTAAPVAHSTAITDVRSAEAEFGDELERLGLRLTRAGLTSSSESRDYGAGDDHLAIYVEPTDAQTPQQYLDRLAPLVHLFVPRVFETNPTIRSFDVCQEPPASTNGEKDPRPETSLLVLHRDIAGVDWQALDLTSVLRLARVEPVKLSVTVSPQIASSDAWVRAVAVAEA